MFNHAVDQNVGWERDLKKLIVTYTALRDIEAGEELCISYGARLTFEDVEKVYAHEGSAKDLLDAIILED